MKKLYTLVIMIILLFSKGCTEGAIIKDEEVESMKINNAMGAMDEIDEMVSELSGEYKNNISIYFKNLNTEEEYVLNEDRYYVAASTTKVPLCMMILDQVFEGEISLDDTIYYEEEDSEAGSGVLYYSDDINSVTVGEAVYLSIVESDNVAKNMLHRISKMSITEYLRDITKDNSIPYENVITARQLYKVLNRLYENPDENPYYNMLIDYMTKTVFNDRLDKYLPYDIVAHKIGSYYRYYHDVGIVYASDPYILVVLTKDIGDLSEESYANGGEDERYLLDYGEYACEMIANISKEIYSIVEEKNG